MKTVSDPAATMALIDGVMRKTYLVKVRGYSRGGDGPVQAEPTKLNLGKEKIQK